MSMVLTRSPLEHIGMNGAGTSKRRSARLSHEGEQENEPPAKRSRANGAHTTAVSTKEQDGDNNTVVKKRSRKTYSEDVDGFSFTKGGRKAKDSKKPPVRNSNENPEKEYPTPPSPAPAPAREMPPPPRPQTKPAPVVEQEPVPKTTAKKPRRRFPTTPEREEAEKPIRRSKRLSNENDASSDPPQAPSPSKSAHARSHAKTAERSPSPEKARPVTVEKKRKRGADGREEEEKIMRIALPFQDTPVIRRNKEMRKSSAEGHRRSSSGMRGRRASSLIDEGRGNEASDSPFERYNSFEHGKKIASQPSVAASSEPTSPKTPSKPKTLKQARRTSANDDDDETALPHSEVATAEFFKHISADLTEPRRMRCLLGWCGTRALPPKPEAPKESTPASNLEFQALQAARVIQAELSSDLVSRDALSNWFARDEAVPPQIPLRKKPNPRNITNAAKLEELVKELESLKQQRAEWDTLMHAAATPLPASDAEEDEALSPLHPELLDSPERAILEQLQAPTTAGATDLDAISQRLRHVAENLEFSVDQFAHGAHAIFTLQQTGERLAEKSLADAAEVLEEREKARRADGKGGDVFGALKALGRVMNGKRRGE